MPPAKPINILLLSLDSISTALFERLSPRTNALLERWSEPRDAGADAPRDFQSFAFDGMNIVGDGTPQVRVGVLREIPRAATALLCVMVV